ncbi:THAP domain-containing protein 6-like [Xyrichtys novacula]|uniref:THAP domain-containing protein 6-like n=1 Tax=Xyrichtys novacula TaxID=13765 RepID=A0AAV1GNQ4_XYRNO|nr:THAP domain-containing protein 6-like [Xyrichtys novacula]
MILCHRNYRYLAINELLATGTVFFFFTSGRFPGDTDLRRKWEIATRREKGFVASESSRLCSEHFRAEDFDRTGQIVRLRDGVTPSVFSFPSRLRRPVATRNTRTSRKAAESLPVDLSQQVPKSGPPSNDPLATRNTGTSTRAEGSRPVYFSHVLKTGPPPNNDHPYALPDSPSHLKTRLSEALARVESLERERLNLRARERRAKKTIKSLLEDLKKRDAVIEELKDRLDFHSGETTLNLVKVLFQGNSLTCLSELYFRSGDRPLFKAGP